MSTTSGNKQKTVNRNQEKTQRRITVSPYHEVGLGYEKKDI